MKTVSRVTLAVLVLAMGCWAQSSPVTEAVRNTFQRQSKMLTAAAEAMPAEEYNFKPTPEQRSFGQVVLHIAQDNNFRCTRLGDAQAPQVKASDTDPKDKLVQTLKDSFEFCATALQQVDDSKLNAEVSMFGGRKGSKADVLVGLTNDLADHYGALAVYMRLKGHLPPSAQGR